MNPTTRRRGPIAAGGFCLCGNPTAIWRGKTWVCQRCLRIESEALGKAKLEGQKEETLPGSAGRSLIDWEHYYYDFTPIYGASLIHLDRLLKKAA